MIKKRLQKWWKYQNKTLPEDEEGKLYQGWCDKKWTYDTQVVPQGWLECLDDCEGEAVFKKNVLDPLSYCIGKSGKEYMFPNAWIVTKGLF